MAFIQNKKLFEEGGVFGPKDAWDTLSIAEKAEMMKIAVKHGIYDLQTIRNKYNEFAEGGNTDDDLVDWIIREEGFIANPRDIGDGKMTLGSGLTAQKWHDQYKRNGNKWTSSDNRRAVREEVANRRRWAEMNIPNWDSLPSSSQKALLSYKYNYDFNQANSPKLFKALADSNLQEAARQMDATSSNAVFRKGLQERRQREQEWFLRDVTSPQVSDITYQPAVSTQVYNPYVQQVEATRVLPINEPDPNSYIRTREVSPQEQRRRKFQENVEAYQRFNALMNLIDLRNNPVPSYNPIYSLFGDNTEGFAKGGKIHINPSKKGTFTAAASKHGMGVQQFASRVLAHPENYSPAMRKKANFAKNAAKWKHELGGPLVKGLLENRYAPGGDITPMNYEYRGIIHSDELKNQGITHVAELPEIVITGRDLKKPYVSSFDGSTEPYVELFGALSKGFQPLSISQHVGAAFDAAQGKRNYFESLFNGNSGFFTDAYAAEHPWVSTLGNMVGDIAIPLGSTMIKGAKGFVISSPKYRLKTPSTTKPDLINFGNVEDGTFRFMGFEEDPIQMHLKRAKAKGYDTTGIEVYDLSKDTPENTAIIEKIAKQYGMTPEDTKTFLLNHLGSYGHAANLRDTKIILHDGIGDNMSARISHEINHLLHKPDAPIPDGSYYPRILKRPDKYFTKLNNTELAARGSQLHDYFGHTGNEPITEEMLEYARQHYIQDTGLNNNMRDFLWTIKDNKKVAEWLTKHATGIVPLGLFGTTMYNTNNE